MAHLFHKWNGCKCTVCGKQRDKEHRLEWGKPGTYRVSSYKYGVLNYFEEPACVQYCLLCGKNLNVKSHEYVQEGCVKRCVRCGFSEPAEHIFVRMKDRCAQRCEICGKEEPLPHTFKGRQSNGVCEQYCSICGFTKTEHSWNDGNGCKCIICGAVRADGCHRWEIITDGKYTNIKECVVCGKQDDSEKTSIEEETECRRRMEAERDAALRREDAMSEMRSMGIKC